MTRFSLIAAVLALPLFLAGCGTLDNLPLIGSDDEPAPAQTAAAQPAANTPPAQPDLEAERDALESRMEELEQELAEVRIELSRVLPAIETLNESARNNAQPNLRAGQAAMPTTSDVMNAAVVDPRFAVHLASYRTTAAANEGWSELRQRFNPVLGSLEPRIAEVEIDGRGTFYRLKAGPFQSWGSANEVCDYLRTSSWSCAVMDFGGAGIN